MNFFGLRLDSAADPTLRALAEACWAVWNESDPQVLQPDEWHLPFVEKTDWQESYGLPGSMGWSLDRMKRVSVARCARLSYTSFETGKRSTIEEDLALYERLVESSPIHASPAEHQATPDSRIQIPYMRPIGTGGGRFEVDHYESGAWINPKEAGNLGPGWRQYRKMLPGEALAPLPEAYR
jgi:hypothetical protein